MRNLLSLVSSQLANTDRPWSSLTPLLTNTATPAPCFSRAEFWACSSIARALSKSLACKFNSVRCDFCFEFNHVEAVKQNVLCSCKPWLLCSMKRSVTKMHEAVPFGLCISLGDSGKAYLSQSGHVKEGCHQRLSVTGTWSGSRRELHGAELLPPKVQPTVLSKV